MFRYIIPVSMGDSSYFQFSLIYVGVYLCLEWSFQVNKQAITYPQTKLELRASTILITQNLVNLSDSREQVLTFSSPFLEGRFLNTSQRPPASNKGKNNSDWNNGVHYILDYRQKTPCWSVYRERKRIIIADKGWERESTTVLTISIK